MRKFRLQMSFVGSHNALIRSIHLWNLKFEVHNLVNELYVYYLYSFLDRSKSVRFQKSLTRELDTWLDITKKIHVIFCIITLCTSQNATIAISICALKVEKIV